MTITDKLFAVLVAWLAFAKAMASILPAGKVQAFFAYCAAFHLNAKDSDTAAKDPAK